MTLSNQKEQLLKGLLMTNNILHFSEETNTTVSLLADLLNDLPVKKVCAIRNKLVPHEVAFISERPKSDALSYLEVYKLDTILSWAKDSNISPYKAVSPLSKDIERNCYYIVVDKAINKDYGTFESEKDALIHAFYELVVKPKESKNVILADTTETAK
jgi:hypothetical protein